MTRVVALWLILATTLGGPAAAQEGAAPNASETPSGQTFVRIVTNSFVLPGKLAKIAAWAGDVGIVADSVNVDTASGAPQEWLEGANLVILDTPRPNDRAMVEARLGSVLEDSAAPWIRVGGGPPGFERLPPRHARRLIAYYANGGETNLRNMLSYVRHWHQGQTVSEIPVPESMPKSGFYHPEAPKTFDNIAAYLSWGASRWPKDAPSVAFAIHSNTLGNMQTKVVDALVEGSEARGMVPLVFWFEAAKPRALHDVFAASKPDVLINLQHMQNGSARSAEFLALDIPVLQSLTYRLGDRAAWRAATSGVPMYMVAPFLSVPESWGMSDPIVVNAIEDGEPAPLPEQVGALLNKAAALAELRRTPPPEKRLALMFWNYPPGEKNLAASHLNVPRSLERLTAALAAAGYEVPPTSEDRVIVAGQAVLGGYYRPETLDKLLADGLADTIPLARYRAWLDKLPEVSRTQILERWGLPDSHWALREIDGELRFIVPRLRLGNLAVMPQPPRAGRPGEAYHDSKVPPDHIYLAAYLYLRETYGAQALIHLGTHGTQEWTPGKDRGLWIGDFPFLAVGDLPVFYPYIQDNISEAIQAKRRGRAVIVSHQTPPFAPAGLYDELRDLHTHLHEYGQLVEGAVRDRTAEQIRALAIKSDLHRDVGWDEDAMAQDFDGFLADLHDHLHGIAHSAMPLGLHTFGEAASPEHRLSTVMQQLGEPYYQLTDSEPDELFVDDFRTLRQSAPYRLLERHLRTDAPFDEIVEPQLRSLLERAGELDRHLANTGEIEALLTGLQGRFVAPGTGGDPIRNPDVPSGRNLYAFEANKIPTQAAYAAGAEAFQKLIDTYGAEHDGKSPEKLAFSLWSSEALRHLGILESQVLHALGLRPVWDKGGRVRALEVIPVSELGRPRIDVVLQVTSVYRDQFDGLMRLLAGAIDEIAQLDEPGNFVAMNARRLAGELVDQGIPEARARELASLRLFSNEPGDYGSGLPDMTLDSTHWESDAPLAEQFLSRLQYAYGAHDWGTRLENTNLFSTQLKGVQAAVFSRSSKLHGMLSTDHPFEFLGGLALAVRHLDGKSPALYVADLRDRQARITGAARFISNELRARYLNPHWITTMQAEGYAGTLSILNVVNNVWGWQATAPETIRADQWQAIHDTFVNDVRELGLNAWFEENNPTAQVQLIERLVEAIRKGYWDAQEQTRRELVTRWQELVPTQDLGASAKITRAFIEQTAAGFGLGAQSAATDTGGAPTPGSSDGAETASDPAEQVRGQVLHSVAPAAASVFPWQLWFGLATLIVCLLGGAIWQAHSNRSVTGVTNSS